MATVYHEISPDALSAARANGLRRTSQGKKSDDSLIQSTDQLLDSHRPVHLHKCGLSRSNNLYAYACHGGSILDITDGTHLPLAEFVAASSQCVLELEVDPDRCFLSDLDAYDRLKAALEQKKPEQTLTELAQTYWNTLMPLRKFSFDAIRRPEVMITYDVPPAYFQVVPRT